MKLNKRVLLLVSIAVLMLDGFYRYPGRRGGHRHPRAADAVHAASMR